MAGKNRNDRTIGKEKKTLTIYFTPELLRYIDDLAEKGHRSRAGQIVYMLEEYMESGGENGLHCKENEQRYPDKVAKVADAISLLDGQQFASVYANLIHSFGTIPGFRDKISLQGTAQEPNANAG